MKISVAKGDGIGVEIMDAVLEVFKAAKVPLTYDMVEMGKSVAQRGQKTGITREAQASVEDTGILFKGPMETPKGGGYKSVNVTARKLWGTFANKRVFRTFPGVKTPTGLQDLNLTMVRENIEDTYGAVEHMQTHDVAQCRRFITRPGSLQVHRYTFEMAARKGARRVTCAHKANIMKMTDGLFLETFYEVAKDYPELTADDVIVDALAMQLIMKPEAFDVIVLPNFQGDILTDMAAGLVGGLAYAPSANLGDSVCIFEAVHGTAPDIAGKGLANPTALLLSGTMMLRHLELVKYAQVIEDALGQTLERMLVPAPTGEPLAPFHTERFVEEMVDAVSDVEILDVAPPVIERNTPEMIRMFESETSTKPVLRGVDVFLDTNLQPEQLAVELMFSAGSAASESRGRLELQMISNRGTQVWPSHSVFTDCVNHYRARFMAPQGEANMNEILALLARLNEGFDVCSVEWLRDLDGRVGYSLAQGQAG